MDYIKLAKQFRTKKKLGQNFLVDEKIIQRIVEEAKISPEENIMEIGAGIGFVTRELAQRAKEVIAVEIDYDAIKELESLPYDNIKIIPQDILTVDLSELTEKPVKIVANIPYYITSPILLHLLGEIDQPDYTNRKYVDEIFLMVQYEVARRIVANEKSPSKEYGLLSILVNYWCETQILCKVKASSFYPSPKVDSALLKLKIRKEPLINLENPTLYRRVVNASFNMRRKNIKNALCMGGFSSQVVEKALQSANISPLIRGETLSMEEFKNLTEEISNATNKS